VFFLLGVLVMFKVVVSRRSLVCSWWWIIDCALV
jgi:hypothetical protein